MLAQFDKISSLAVNLKKTNLAPFGHTLPADILSLKDHTGIKIVENFKLLGIEFNNKILPEDLKDSTGKVVLMGMNNIYKVQMEKMRKEMFAWYKIK